MAGAAPVIVAQNREYADRHWRREWRARDVGDQPAPCPKCGRRGFYGPRIRPFARYRACRFCGFWQDVGRDPEYRLPTFHGCLRWPVIAGAPYLWWVPARDRIYTCPYCLAEVDRTVARARNPFLFKKHPWWRVPQSRTGRWYRLFWNTWRFSGGRAYM